MKTEQKKIKIKDIVQGFKEAEDGTVVGLNGRLDIRPPYQREYIHENNDNFKKNLINSIYQNLPIGLIYFAAKDGGGYELLDGQQRIMTICRYVAKNQFSCSIDGTIKYYTNLSPDQKEKIDNYDLIVYVCTGNIDDKMKWFQTINTGAEQLSNQELRNSFYSGSWLTDAKHYFTAKGNQANMCKRFMDGKRERQEHLEKIMIWKIGSTKDEDIRAFMAEHENDTDAKPLWDYFREVIEWVDCLFPDDNPHKQKAGWGRLHRGYKSSTYNQDNVKKRFRELQDDEEVQNKTGVYEYILSGEINEKFLNLRLFDTKIKDRVWKKQGKKCNYSSKCRMTELALADAHADHIMPWAKGGKTEEKNCQILCRDCNLSKSNK